MLIRVLYGHALQSTFEAWCVGVTSSRGQGGPVLGNIYPCPTRGAAGPVSGARRGRQGGRGDPTCIPIQVGEGKGLNTPAALAGMRARF